MARQQQDVEKPTLQKERIRRIRDLSPYSKNFKCYIKSDEKDLIYKRQAVTKLSRKDLEDKYIELCDENFFIKRNNNELQDKVKELTTKLVRISSAHRSYSSTAILRERTSENIAESTRIQPSYSKPMIRSSSLNTVYRRRAQSATPSEASKTSSSSVSTQRSGSGSDGSKTKESNQQSEKGITEISEKETNNDEQLEALRKRVLELTEEIKQEQEKNSKIILEKEKIESRLTDIDMKQYLVENIEISRLKRKLEQIRGAVKRMQSQHKHDLIEKEEKLDSERKKFNNLIDQINEENTFTTASDRSKNELKSALRSIEMLRKQVSELEFDKKSLMDQQESFSKLLKEAATREKEVLSASNNSRNNALLETLEQLKTEKAAIENSKKELCIKIRELQDMNDRLVVDLEGLKTLRSFREDFTGKDDSIGNEIVLLLSEENEVTAS